MTTKTTSTTTRPRKRRVTRKAANLTASARDLAGQVGSAPSRLAHMVPGAMNMVESMPKAQRNKVASVSFAVGAGLYLFGAPRILAFLALMPALAVGGTSMLRGLSRR